MKILVLNGPNLNLLGRREPEIYGSLSMEQINAELTTHFPKTQLDFFQSNCEAVLIDALHAACSNYAGVVFNPAAFTHYSIALRDAIAAITVPVVEVHLSNPEQRENFRKINLVRDVCASHFQGHGAQSYMDAVNYLIGRNTDGSV